MTLREMNELLLDINFDAKVFVEADHGQQPEQAYEVHVTHDKKLDKVDEIHWREVSQSAGLPSATAILIS